MNSRKTIKRKVAKQAPPPPETLHKVEGKAVVSGLHKARVPSRFVRPEVTLDAFPWGRKMRKWIDVMLADNESRSRSRFVVGPSDLSLSACAMLTRTLVMRGHDAVLVTLEELMAEDDLRQSEFLIVAGFWDADFHKKRGCPLSPAESFKLSWRMWRMANDGTSLIVFCAPSSGGMSAWWHVGALQSMFTHTDTLHLP